MPSDENVPNRWIPPGYQRVTYKDPVNAVCFIKRAPKIMAMGFIGKQKNPAFHYSYKTLEAANAKMAAFFEFCREVEARKAKNREDSRNYQHDYQVGEILVGTWGYDQTNVDFFQVTAIPSKKTIRIRPIASTSVSDEMPWAQDMVYPVRNNFTGGESLHRVFEGARIKSPVHGYARRWDYNAVHETSYA